MRRVLTWMSALLLCGCFMRAKPDLLQARLREQQDRVAEMERQLTEAQADLQHSRRDAELLRAEIARAGKSVLPVEYHESLIRARKLQINSLMSGGLNRDQRPGDDAFVTLISLVDDDSEVVKLPGAIELTLIDPALPESSRQVGQWRFTPEECRSKWTRGFAGVGYQFTVSLDRPVQHEQLVLHAKLTAADSRAFDASQMIRITPAADSGLPPKVANAPDGPQVLDDINNPPPPPSPSGKEAAVGEPRLPEWSNPNPPSGRVILDSSSWEKDSIPVRR